MNSGDAFIISTTGARDAHNLLLHLLLEGGIVGTLPFLVGLWLCGQSAWKARSKPLGLLPLALFCAMLSCFYGPHVFAAEAFLACSGARVRGGVHVCRRTSEQRQEASHKTPIWEYTVKLLVLAQNYPYVSILLYVPV